MKKLAIKEQIKVLRQASRLLKGGIPLIKALEVSGFPRETIGTVSGGGSLSSSMEKYFSDGIGGLAGVGEMSGQLETMLQKAAETLEKKADLSKKIIKAVSYPLVVLSVSVACLAAFIGLGVPMMKEVFVSFGVPLPRSIAIIDSLAGMTAPLGAAVAVIFASLFVMNKKNIFLAQRERVKYGFPFFGSIAVKLENSVIFRDLSVLLGSGMPLAHSLERTKISARSALFREALGRVSDKICGGQKVSSAFGQEKYFEKRSVKMMEAAEEAAYLDKVFGSAADMLEEEAHDTIRSATMLIEPLSTLLVGAAVGFVVVSMFSPIMKILSSL